MSSACVASNGPPLHEALGSPRCLNSWSYPYPDESILIYLAAPGSMIPLVVLASDSIESLKLRIQSHKGFMLKNQKLVCGGRELARSNSLIREYGVTNGNVLHLFLKLSDLQLINVKTVSGKEFTFRIERGKDVEYVKRQIAKRGKEFVDLDEQEVLYDGERVEDQKLIDDICKDNDAVLYLIVKKTAKIREKPVEKNFELSIVSANDVRENKWIESGASEETNSRVYDASEETNRKVYDVNQEILPRKPLKRSFSLEPVIINPKLKLPSVVSDMVTSTFDGLDSENNPVKSREGTGGVYLMQDSLGERFVSVFKPIDEEPLAVNNPHGLPISDGEGLKKGTRVGEGALREVAAYILDHPKSGLFGDEKGFAGVPPTVLVECLHPGFNHPKEVKVKIGSLQKFVENSGSCEDLGPGGFRVEEVHKISVLDMRLANTDRHAGNILMSKDKDGRTLLVPIDHGYCLPESFEDCTFEWLYWPQSRKPYSSEIVEYINSLNAEEDIALLKHYGWELPFESARTLRISTMLLKKGVERGLTPFDIGNIMCRETLTKESTLEEMIEAAQGCWLPGTSEAAFLESLSNVMDNRLDEIVSTRKW